MNDSNYPWFILVPKRNNISEIYELSRAEQSILISEISFVSKVVKQNILPDKINIGALGNIVSQLHIHIVARFKADISWPDPIWGKNVAIPYKASETEKYIKLFYG